MDELWERAIEAARAGEELDSVCSLTLDGALKVPQNRMPSPSLLEQFPRLRVLSIANVALTSLAGFPSLPHLEKLNLSDNRLSGGLEHLAKASLISLRDLDLSNNKIQGFEDLSPLADLNIVYLDLYECPVTRLPDYRSKVFEMIKSLKYLDKLDAESNERPETEEEESGGSEEENGFDDDEDGAVNVEEEESENGDEDNVEEDEGEEDAGNTAFASTGCGIAAQEERDEEEDGDGVEDDEEEDNEEEYGTEYLVRPIAQAEDEEDASDFEPGEDEEDEDDINEEEDQDDGDLAPPLKKKRSKDESDDTDKDERSPKH